MRRIELLILSSLARKPMHGYEIKTELRYKHVKWWAKCDHGHLYATLPRLLKKGYATAEGEGRRNVYAITDAGRAALLAGLRALAVEPDDTHFAIDLFVSGTFLLPRDDVLALLTRREAVLAEQLEEARALKEAMGEYVPLAAHLIMEHRAEHLEREIAFARRLGEAFAAEERWGSFLQDRAIVDFVVETGVELED